jgi:predicted component of type VI protein secretion system
MRYVSCLLITLLVTGCSSYTPTSQSTVIDLASLQSLPTANDNAHDIISDMGLPLP